MRVFSTSLLHQLNNRMGILKMKTYKELLEAVEDVQTDLMNIEDYSEEVYQALQTAIDELEELAEN
ncbi:gp16 [Brochothrix phage A9]|uniref:Gp16 n=1 Tax=Brochothrix phage A9 TaxID=857312 RepID=D9J0G3_9CAUD|nr:gp16 [Brochothrix phage A9]ADJ53058.1 gp16 [Brochothrix phage A9]